MGLLDRFKPPPLLRSGPLLLVPSGTSPDVVDSLVATWAPLRRSEGDGWNLTDGLRWVGPIEVTMTDASEFDLPGGYPLAYVAQAKRSRGDTLADRLMDRTMARSLARSEASLDAFILEQDGITREELDARKREADAAVARDYPQGEPRGSELDGWHLVCGLARRLRGTCRLADSRFFIPDLGGPDGEATLYARTLLDADEVASLVAPVLGELTVGEPDTPELKVFGRAVSDTSEWYLARGSGEGEISVAATVWERDLELRSPFDPLAAYDRTGGRTVEYDVIGPDGSQPDILRACALLAAATDGVVLDQEGFAVEMPPV